MRSYHLYQKAQSLALAIALMGSPTLISILILPQASMAQITSERLAEANQLLQQGNEQFNNGRQEAALQSWQKALVIYQEIHDQQGEAGTLINIGGYYAHIEFEKAIIYYEKALSIFRYIKDSKGEANALMNIGWTSYIQADYIAYQSSKVESKTPNNCQKQTICTPLNRTILYEKAITYYEQALPIMRSIKDLKNEGTILGYISAAYMSLGQFEKASGYLEQACQVFEQIKDSPDKCSK
jgi:tetratricopeptide (TPR) repeat protein